MVSLVRARNGRKVEKLIRTHLTRGKSIIKKTIRRQRKG
jgi:hypothetical protein